MRSIEKIGELEEEIKENLLEILCRLNWEERKLEELLTLLGIEENETVYKTSRSGKIIVIGDSKVPEWFLLAVARDLGLSKARFEFELDYATAEKYDFKKTQWKRKYSAILFGPVPHSGKAKGDWDSVISRMENEAGFPPIVLLGANELKITRNSFQTALQGLFDDGILTAG